MKSVIPLDSNKLQELLARYDQTPYVLDRSERDKRSINYIGRMPSRGNEIGIRENHNGRIGHNGSGRNYSRPQGSEQNRNSNGAWVNREIPREPLNTNNLERSRERNVTRGGVEQVTGSQQRGEVVSDQLIRLN